MYKMFHHDAISKLSNELICYEDESDWGAVVENFQIFLSGCGFLFHTEFNMKDILEDAHKELMNIHYNNDDGDSYPE